MPVTSQCCTVDVEPTLLVCRVEPTLLTCDVERDADIYATESLTYNGTPLTYQGQPLTVRGAFVRRSIALTTYQRGC